MKVRILSRSHFRELFRLSLFFLWDDHYHVVAATPLAVVDRICNSDPPPNPPPQEWDFGRFAPKSKFSTFYRELFRLSLFFRVTTATTLSLVIHLRPSRICNSDPPPNPPPQEWDFGRFAPKSIFSTFCRELFWFSFLLYRVRSITLTPLRLSLKTTTPYMSHLYRKQCTQPTISALWCILLIFKDSIFIFIYNKKR